MLTSRLGFTRTTARQSQTFHSLLFLFSRLFCFSLPLISLSPAWRCFWKCGCLVFHPTPSSMLNCFISRWVLWLSFTHDTFINHTQTCAVLYPHTPPHIISSSFVRTMIYLSFFFLVLLNCLFLPSRGFPSAEPGSPPPSPFISRTGSSMMLSVTDVCVFVCSGACFYMCFSLIIIIDVVTVFLLIEHFHGDLVCITLSWHQSPPVFVVSVSLPPSLLLRCLIGPSFSVPPFLFLSLSSLHSGTPSSFWVEPQSNAFKLVLLFTLPLWSLHITPSLSPFLLSLSPSLLLLVLCLRHIHTFGVFVALFVCVCVFSVLIQQRRKGKQRGSNLSVCTLSSLSSPSSPFSLFKSPSQTCLCVVCFFLCVCF